MNEEEPISSMNTHFLESLLLKIGRRDLCIKIEMYYIKRHAKMSDDTKASHKTNHSMKNTTRKQLHNQYICQSKAYTSLKTLNNL